MNWFYPALFSILIFFGVLDLVLTGRETRGALACKWPLHGAIFFFGQLASATLPFTSGIASFLAAYFGIGAAHSISSFSLPLQIFVWLLCQTFCIYCLHYALHRFRPLWAFHRVHHNDELVESTCALRAHPLEFFVAHLMGTALAFLFTPSLLTLVLAYLIILTIDLFNHSLIKLPDELSDILEWVIVTPRMHAVHHSPLPSQTDTNFGGTFTWWDRLFGTYRREIPAGQGLDDYEFSGEKSRDFEVLLFEPISFLRRGKDSIPKSRVAE